MALRPWLRLHYLGTRDTVEACVYGRSDAAADMGEAMSIDAMKQALDALEHEARTGNDDAYRVERNALRAAIEQAHGDWDEVEALRKSLREHMAEIHRLQSALEQEPVAWVYPEGLEALKSGRPWTAYGSSGDGRIPLYLNDAVARRAEPRESGSGAGFESLPASPTWWDEPDAQMNYRQWQGLTDDEIVLICGECAASHADDLRYARAIETRLKEKNT